MRNALIISLLFFSNSACSAQVENKLTPEVFKMQIENETDLYQILDLRTDDEIAQGKVPGAEQLDFFGEDFDANLNELNKEATYYIYCRSGNRSGKTYAKMKSLGFEKVYDMEGGMNAWKAKGFETE